MIPRIKNSSKNAMAIAATMSFVLRTPPEPELLNLLIELTFFAIQLIAYTYSFHTGMPLSFSVLGAQLNFNFGFADKTLHPLLSSPHKIETSARYSPLDSRIVRAG